MQRLLFRIAPRQPVGHENLDPRGQIADQQIAWFQVKLDIGFRVEAGTDLGAG
jgi:hypothetical protein